MRLSVSCVCTGLVFPERTVQWLWGKFSSAAKAFLRSHPFVEGVNNEIGGFTSHCNLFLPLPSSLTLPSLDISPFPRLSDQT